MNSRRTSESPFFVHPLHMYKNARRQSEGGTLMTSNLILDPFESNFYPLFVRTTEKVRLLRSAPEKGPDEEEDQELPV